MPKFKDRLQHAWNAFMNKDPTPDYYYGSEVSCGYNYSRPRLSRGNERSIINAIYNRMAVDAATIDIKHVKVDEKGNFSKLITESGLNECFSVGANIDQTGRDFLQDIVLSMFDEGVVAIVPVDTEIDPTKSPTVKINSMRTGKIVDWYPSHVKIDVYNEKVGKRQEITLPKSAVGIVYNPFYTVMNEPNSTAKRLIRKLNILDSIDEQTGSDKLNMIIKLPYQAKTKIKQEQAAERTKNLEEQLAGSKLGIGYIDATENITQLNRPLENNLMGQIEYLYNLLFSQLCITPEILNGTADPETMNNYLTRTIEPILSAITEEMHRKFLTKTARSQGHAIKFYRDPFKIMSTNQIAEISDKMTRNEIMSANEMRQKLGLLPAEDPGADELRNKNLSPSKDEFHVNVDGDPIPEENMQLEEDTKTTPEEIKRLEDQIKLRRKNQNGV